MDFPSPPEAAAPSISNHQEPNTAPLSSRSYKEDNAPPATHSQNEQPAERSRAPRPPLHSRSPSATTILSRPISLPPGTTPTTSSDPQPTPDLTDIKSDVMVNWLYQQQLERLWTSGGPDEGVVLKKARGVYISCPADMMEETLGLGRSIETLNVRVAMTVNTRVIKLFLSRNQRPYVPLKNGLRVQVLPDVAALARCQKHQFAAFIADMGILVVWDDEPRHLLDRARKFEKALMEMIWDGEVDGDTNNDNADDKRNGSTLAGGGGGAAQDPSSLTDEGDVERGTRENPRKTMMLTPFFSAGTLCLVTLALGSGYRSIAIETVIDSYYPRLIFVFTIPPLAWLSLFFFQAIVNNTAQMLGPVNQVHQNTKFYSGLPPWRLRRDSGPLPHVTIQLPVYKEGLRAVIEPTVRSLKAAISTYEMQGGTANIFVNDDGMQLIPLADARARRDFYDEHNIGWVARPKHNPPKPKKDDDGEEEVFLRRGKFKKASNMNYALWVSVRVEERLTAVERDEGWTQDDEAETYHEALAAVLEEDAGRTWAEGNIRLGDYILLIDSDTRVPEDCFLDCVSEMEQSPQVAIIQYSSGVMNVTDSFFERGITFFTHLVYTQIRYAVATGDVAPFVGHNAVLRWAAVQDIAYDCPLDNREKYWSEATVSEDFDMALRLQTAGYLVRLGAYTGDGFQEGVSLTVYDELSRWEKYAYGCSELIFHPFHDWLFRGPFTPLFKRFIASSMPLPSKITIMAYVGTYYALGSAWLLTLANYFLTGWLNGYLDHYYLDSFKAYFAIILVFSGMGNLALAVLRYRTKEKTLLRSLRENITWIPLLAIFLGGISMHVSQAILSHLFGVDMSWGATSKEAEDTTFFEEVPRIMRKFKVTFVFCLGCAAMMVVCARLIPPLWRIELFIAIFPLSAIIVGHFFLPIALNPGLMRFTW